MAPAWIWFERCRFKKGIQNKRAKNIETILDRKQAIAQAIQIAEPSDVVLVTGKGSEQFLVLPENNRIDWDEREIVKGLIA